MQVRFLLDTLACEIMEIPQFVLTAGKSVWIQYADPTLRYCCL